MKAVTEEELVAKAVAPRVTKEALEANIKGATYFYHGLLTICVIELMNGFTVVGESACASPENYDKDVGERLSYGDAKNKIWAPMGYHLKQTLFEEATEAASPSGVSEANETWEDRLRKEADENALRLSKLKEFLDGPLYAALPDRDQRLLREQADAMTTLDNILVSRLVGIS